MGNQAELIHHFTDFDEFEDKGLNHNGLAFPELEKVLQDYILSQLRETMEFQECWVEEKQVDGRNVRMVQVIFKDHNLKNFTRLWGSRDMDDDQVLSMKVDAIDWETKEVVYERKLA